MNLCDAKYKDWKQSFFNLPSDSFPIYGCLLLLWQNLRQWIVNYCCKSAFIYPGNTWLTWVKVTFSFFFFFEITLNFFCLGFHKLKWFHRIVRFFRLEENLIKAMAALDLSTPILEAPCPPPIYQTSWVLDASCVWKSTQLV